jgi:hypothetical protein
MAYDRSKHDAAGKPIGSPNDPLIGIAPGQATGPGGKGLKKRPQQSPEEENSDSGEVGQGK